MTDTDVFATISGCGVIPVLVLERAEHAVPLADALLAGGLGVVEITFRTAAAAEAIALLTRERPQMLVGAGTLLTTDNLASAIASGARFGVAPGFNPAVHAAAVKAGLLFIPGIATPTEVETALAAGCRLLKFFPAEALGGIAMLEAIAAPYRHTGVRFMPTGGVKPANLEDYLRLDIVSAVGGTWFAKTDDLATGKWDEIRSRASAASSAVNQARAGRPQALLRAVPPGGLPTRP